MIENVISDLALKYPDLFLNGTASNSLEELDAPITKENVDEYKITNEDVILFRLLGQTSLKLKELRNQIEDRDRRLNIIENGLVAMDSNLLQAERISSKYTLVMSVVAATWLFYPLFFNTLVSIGGWWLFLSLGVPYTLLVIWATMQIEEAKNIKISLEKISMLMFELTIQKQYNEWRDNLENDKYISYTELKRRLKRKEFSGIFKTKNIDYQEFSEGKFQGLRWTDGYVLYPVK